MPFIPEAGLGDENCDPFDPLVDDVTGIDDGGGIIDGDVEAVPEVFLSPVSLRLFIKASAERLSCGRSRLSGWLPWANVLPGMGVPGLLGVVGLLGTAGVGVSLAGVAGDSPVSPSCCRRAMSLANVEGRSA